MDIHHSCGGPGRGRDKVQVTSWCWGYSSSSCTPSLHLLHTTRAKVGNEGGHLASGPNPSPIQIWLLPTSCSRDLILLVEQLLLLSFQPQQGIQLLL